MEQKHGDMSATEIGGQGRKIYQEHLRQQLESDNIGQYLAIDVVTGEYALATERSNLLIWMSSQPHRGHSYLMRIGYPAAVYMGGRRLRERSLQSTFGSVV